MSPAGFYSLVLLPSSNLLPFHNTLESRVLLMAIAGQESGWANRTQVDGPARGFWQFDMTAVLDLLANPATGLDVLAACVSWSVPRDPTTIYAAIAWHDPLAYEMARWLLWADPAPLPPVGDEAAGWACYDRVWRPGTPRRDAWAPLYAHAVALVT